MAPHLNSARFYICSYCLAQLYVSVPCPHVCLFITVCLLLQGPICIKVGRALSLFICMRSGNNSHTRRSSLQHTLQFEVSTLLHTPSRSTGIFLYSVARKFTSVARAMEKRDEDLKKAQVLDARARNISHNVRCTECGSQSIEDSQADIAILLRQLIRDEIGAGKTDKEIYSKLEDEFGETVLYAPKFDMQTAALWLTPVLIAGGTAAGLAYSKHRQRTNVHIMALDLIRGVPLTPKERVTILDLLIPPPPPPQGLASRLRRWLNLR